MNFLFYVHSLSSDWNHGNAHFLRGVLRELISRGHQATALAPEDGWSRQSLLADQGPGALANFEGRFPELTEGVYGPGFDHEAALVDADVVLVHEWTDPDLVAAIGKIKRDGGRFTLLFHDTHHRAVSQERAVADLLLSDYDGVLAFGESLREHYIANGWGRRAFTWHEAADIRLFKPLAMENEGDLVWIGNWGDDERSAELREFLIGPVRATHARAVARGVRYPPEALREIEAAGIAYRGWIANADVPREFARHRVTMHIPRRPYVEALPGIPTIRVFEALACGIPLLSAPWSDSEGLFRTGEDFLTARDGAEMTRLLREILIDHDRAAELARSGLERILDRHTCAHRVDELLQVVEGVAPQKPRRMEVFS